MSQQNPAGSDAPIPPPSPPSRHDDGWRRALRAWLVHRPLEHETALFLLVCALDLFMTYVLLRRGGFRESNPVADWFLMRWGFSGMIGFKFATAAIVTVIAQVVAEKRLRTGRWLLRFGTLIVAGVVIYSLGLFLQQQYGS